MNPSNNSSDWKPLLDVSSPGRILFLKKLSEIAETLLTHLPTFKSNNGIVSDRVGAVLFLFYYAKFMNDDKYAQIAFDLISMVFDELSNEIADGRLSSGSDGLAGVGWTLEHLAQNDFLEIDTNEMLGEIDIFLYETMLKNMEKREYDYLNGALQKGLYFLSRRGNRQTSVYLSHLVDVLEKVAEKDKDGGLKFLSRVPDDGGGESYVCNLGMAHGMPSIAWFLGKLLDLDIARDKVTGLLNAFVSYIFKHFQDTSVRISHFPGWVIGESSPADSRLAWCFGDPGLGIGLWQASGSCGNKDWEKMITDVLLHSTGRRDLEKNAVVDAGMCHGTVGLAHIYNRMFHYTGIKNFEDAALYWLDETLKMATFKDGYAGFKRYHSQWINSADIFDGISGIGLALLAAVSDSEPRWDRMMMMS
ncbi:MAG: lanthionine synthetase C family protein [Candidatus Aminicenantes bacterium]|nr:lanthionine synthetase C family protein [Candidatus Aminicenantes bacterium]